MIDPSEVNIDCVVSKTKRCQFACDGVDQPVQSIYMIFNELYGQPLRLFLKKGHTGLCVQALLEAVARLLTIIIQQTDLDLERVWKTLIGITCHAGSEFVDGKSCMDALAKELKTCYPARFALADETEMWRCAPTD